MANTYKNIVIVPNVGSSSGDPKIIFSGANTTVNTDITLSVNPTSNGTISLDGNRQLFSITNSMNGIIFSVNDINGIPNIEVSDTGIIRLSQYNGNVIVGSNTPSTLITANTTGVLYTGNIVIGGSNTTTGITFADGTRQVSAGLSGGSVSGFLANSIIIANNSGYLSNTTNLSFYTSNNTLFTSNISVSNTATITRVVANVINELTSAPAISAGVLTLNLNNGPVFNVALNAAITSITLTNVSSANTVSSFILIFTADGTLRSVAWPASFSWPNGITPAITPTLNKKDVYTFFTIDGGNRWNAFVTGQGI